MTGHRQSARRAAPAYLLFAAAVASLYGAATLPSHLLLIPNVFVSPIRLSAGMAIAAMTVAPTRLWWLVLLAMIPAHAWAGDPATRYLVALQYFLANVAESLVAASVLRRLVGVRPQLDSLRTCVTFLVACVIIGPLVGATIGVPAIIRRDLTISPFSTWAVWAFADATGNLVVVPICLALADWYTRLRTRFRPHVAPVRVVEALAVGMGMLVTIAPGLGQAALGRPAPLGMLYLPFPLLIWASIRFGPAGAAAANLILTAVTIRHALTMPALFGQPWSATTVLETQQFLIVAAATSITLAALTAERRRAREAARENEERMRLSLHGARIGTWSWNFESNRFRVSDQLASLADLDAATVHGLEQDFTALARIIHPNDLEFVRADLDHFRFGTLTDERSSLFHTIRPDGTSEWLKRTRQSPLGDDVSAEFRIVRPDGTTVFCEGHGRTLMDANGLRTGALGIVIDITERKTLDRERDAATRALINLARSTFGDRGEIDEAMREITSTAADTLNVERATIWLFSEHQTHLRCVDLYERTARRHSSGAELTVERYPEYFKAVQTDRTLAVDDTNRDARTCELASAHREMGVTSMLDAPVHVGGQLAGVFSCQHVGPPREWSLEARNFAGSVADLLSRTFEAVERRKAEQRLQRAYDQLRSLARRFEAAKEDERRHIARELHDELGQSLTAIVIALHLVSRDDAAGRHAARLGQTVALAEQLIQRVRAISLNLRPPLLDELGLMPALRGYLEGQAEQCGLTIEVDFGSKDVGVPPELEIGAFRIVQECLTNIVRHAGARRVGVRMAADGDYLLIEVADDGRGFDVATALERAGHGYHLGLLGLQERVTMLGGQVQFVSAAGQGTRVAARLPLNLAADAPLPHKSAPSGI